MPVLEINPSVYLTKGWCQGAFEKIIDGKRFYCFLGAVNQSYIGIRNFEEGKTQFDFKRTANEILIERGFQDPLVTVWQDAIERTQEEVVELALEIEERLGL